MQAIGNRGPRKRCYRGRKDISSATLMGRPINQITAPLPRRSTGGHTIPTPESNTRRPPSRSLAESGHPRVSFPAWLRQNPIRKAGAEAISARIPIRRPGLSSAVRRGWFRERRAEGLFGPCDPPAPIIRSLGPCPRAGRGHPTNEVPGPSLCACCRRGISVVADGLSGWERRAGSGPNFHKHKRRATATTLARVDRPHHES